MITRRLPRDGDAATRALFARIAEADAAFTNIELVPNGFRGHPSSQNGGSHIAAAPFVLDELLDAGFNLFNVGNNHSLDYGIAGLLATIEELDRRGMVYSGVGQTLELSLADILVPLQSLRSIHRPWNEPPAYLRQVEVTLVEGLRRAGMRDHADAEADSGEDPDVPLEVQRQDYYGPTPMRLPGGRIIGYRDLAAQLESPRLLLLSTDNFSNGSNQIPGATLVEANLNGHLNDPTQDKLRERMDLLTDSDLDRPVVVYGYDCERWSAFRLAVRLVALGYRDVQWYRGGEEDWEVHGGRFAPRRVMAL